MQKNILKTSFAAAASISMLVACGPAPTGTPTPSGSPSASVAPTAAPSASVAPSAEPTAAPSASVAPSAEPTAAPSATVAPTAAPTAAPSATATPLPAATSDISVIEKTTFNGKIFDDTNSPLDGVTVKVKSLNSSVPYEAETVTAGGTFAFNNAPSGVQVEILASKAGFTTRKRVEVLKSNKQGDPNANRYDFGTDGSGTGFSATYNALSDKPEVTMVTPGRNASGVDPKTSFVLKFSEPMDKKTVEDTFAVRTFNARKLTVDSGNTGNTTSAEAGTIKVPTFGGTKVWDKDAFNISWNSDDTEVTFSFKEERLLPTDKDSNLVPDYMVSFQNFNNDKLLKDKSGISRDKEYFKLTDGDFEGYYKFAIKTDEVKPTITGITAETNENGGQNGDAVRVRYSERMIIYSRDKSIAGGMDDVAGADTKAPAGYPGAANNATVRKTASNYNITIIETGGAQGYSGTWGALGGTAVYDTSDLTHKTVLLLPGTSSGTFTQSTAALANGDTLTGTATLDDGSTVAISSAANAGGALYSGLQTALNNLTPALTGGTFTVTGSNATSAVGTTHSITLSGTPVINTKKVRYITFTGGVNAANMGVTATTPYNVYPAVAAGSRMNIYKPGDTVRIKVNSTVLDPAGNTLDSSRDNSSANAS